MDSAVLPPKVLSLVSVKSIRYVKLKEQRSLLRLQVVF